MLLGNYNFVSYFSCNGNTVHACIRLDRRDVTLIKYFKNVLLQFKVFINGTDLTYLHRFNSVCIARILVHLTCSDSKLFLIVLIVFRTVFYLSWIPHSFFVQRYLFALLGFGVLLSRCIYTCYNWYWICTHYTW